MFRRSRSIMAHGNTRLSSGCRPAGGRRHGRRGAESMARVLVIEDDPQTADEIAAALGDHGYQVECVGTGREGLLKAATEHFEAVVLDRMLPGGMDGLAVLATLRATGSNVPVLVLSALSAGDERV